MSHVSRYLEPTLVEHLNHLQLSARSIVEGSTIGQHKSPRKGVSVEFRQHRFYVPGDEPKRLDWRVLARTDRPYVKEYDEETNLRCVLMLDASGSMSYGRGGATKFDYAARLLAAFAYLMLGQTEAVGVAICADGIGEYLAPSAGPLQLSRVFDALERCVPQGPSGMPRAMHQVAERLERRSLVIALSDFFQPSQDLKAGWAHLRHERHEVIALQVTDRDEEEFSFANWCRFRGLEGESAQLVEPALARKVYLENYTRHRRALQEACLSLRVELGSFVTDRPILEAIRLFLARHNR